MQPQDHMKKMLSVLTESKKQVNEEYDSSIDFEDDVSTVQSSLDQILSIIMEEAWVDWIMQTGYNYDTSGDIEDLNEQLQQSVLRSKKILDALYNRMTELG